VRVFRDARGASHRADHSVGFAARQRGDDPQRRQEILHAAGDVAAGRGEDQVAVRERAVAEEVPSLSDVAPANPNTRPQTSAATRFTRRSSAQLRPANVYTWAARPKTLRIAALSSGNQRALPRPIANRIPLRGEVEPSAR
jgi:hypothetical protein